MLAGSFAAVCCIAALPAHAGAQDDGLRLAAEGRCSEAIEVLAAEQLSSDASARARALCLLQEAWYGEAAEALAALEPADPSLAADLGIALFHAGKVGAAEVALRRAEQYSPTRPEVDLYLGLIALDRAQSADAGERFARVASEAGTDPLASAAAYYSGLTFARAGDLDAARAAFARVAREWPGTAWAAEAERELTRIGEPNPSFATIRLGFEYDDNAVLRGDGVLLPPEIASASDERFVWRVAAGRTFSAAKATQIGAAFTFGGSVHGDLSRFDTLVPALTLWADRALGERTTLRGLASYEHAWVGRESFLSAPSIGLELHRSWAELGASRAFAELGIDDYRFRAPGVTAAERRARDRDGLGVRVGLAHSLPLPSLASALRGSVAYRRFTADGTEYSFDSPELELGWDATLPAKLQLGAGVRYGYRAYRHPTTYGPPAVERREHDWRTELSLGLPVWRQVRVEARWRYQRTRSNADVFDYSRHVAGVQATWTLSP